MWAGLKSTNTIITSNIISPGMPPPNTHTISPSPKKTHTHHKSPQPTHTHTHYNPPPNTHTHLHTQEHTHTHTKSNISLNPTGKKTVVPLWPCCHGLRH